MMNTKSRYIDHQPVVLYIVKYFQCINLQEDKTASFRYQLRNEIRCLEGTASHNPNTIPPIRNIQKCFSMNCLLSIAEVNIQLL